MGLNPRKHMLSEYACYGLLNSTQGTENSWAQTKVGATGEAVWGCMLCNYSKIQFSQETAHSKCCEENKSHMSVWPGLNSGFVRFFFFILLQFKHKVPLSFECLFLRCTKHMSLLILDFAMAAIIIALPIPHDFSC